MLAEFTFPTSVSCSTLRIGPFLFYIEKFITQFKTTEKNLLGCCTLFWENYDIPLWQGPAIKKKPPFVNVYVHSCEIMCSRVAQCNTGEWP